MITWTKRMVLTLSFLTLIITNVLSLTSAAFNAALSGLVSATFGVQTISETFHRKLAANKKTINAQKKTINAKNRTINAKNKTINAQNKTIKKHTAVYAKRKAATKRFGTRLASRTKRVATESVVAIPGEAIPYLGITFLVAGTSYELYAACESMEELDELYSDMGMEDEVPDNVLHSVCDPSLPDMSHLWGGTVKISRDWWDRFLKLYPF